MECAGLKGVILDDAYLLEDLVFHVHIATHEEDDVLDQAYAQDGQVAFAENVQVLVRAVQQELVYEDVQLHSQRPWVFHTKHLKVQAVPNVTEDQRREMD
jgi:hypothetical protein